VPVEIEPDTKTEASPFLAPKTNARSSNTRVSANRQSKLAINHAFGYVLAEDLASSLGTYLSKKTKTDWKFIA
jgi:hypothetical protein